MQQSRNKHYFFAIIAAFFLILLDQFTKKLAVIYLKEQNSFVIIKDVFQLEYLENRGAAFGILQNQRIFFYLCAIIILVVVGYFYHKVPMEKKYLPLRICAVMILSGAIGNLIDRALLNYVVDFFYFKLINFPVFNVADIYVTVSAILLIILVCFYYKEEDLEQVFGNKRK